MKELELKQQKQQHLNNLKQNALAHAEFALFRLENGENKEINAKKRILTQKYFIQQIKSATSAENLCELQLKHRQNLLESPV